MLDRTSLAQLVHFRFFPFPSTHLHVLQVLTIASCSRPYRSQNRTEYFMYDRNGDVDNDTSRLVVITRIMLLVLETTTACACTPGTY